MGGRNNAEVGGPHPGQHVRPRRHPAAGLLAAGDRRQALQSTARELARDARALQKVAACAPAARREAERLQEEAEKALAEAQALKLQARLEDLIVWEMEKVKQSRKGSKTYSYWMASWREGGKTRNVYLGSAGKMDAAEARQKARAMKAESLGMQSL